MIPAPRAGLATVGDGHRRRSVGRRQSARSPAQRRSRPSSRRISSRRASTRSFRLRIGCPSPGSTSKFPGTGPVPRSVQPGLARDAPPRRSERRPSPFRTRSWSVPPPSTSSASACSRSNNSRRLDDPFLSITNAGIGIPNPATFFDSSDATLRLGPLRRRARHDHGTVLVRRTERHVQPAQSADVHDRRHADLDEATSTPSGSAASSDATNSTRTFRKSRRQSSRSSRTSRMILRGLATRGRHAVRHHRQAVPLQRFQRLRGRRLATVESPDA